MLPKVIPVSACGELEPQQRNVMADMEAHSTHQIAAFPRRAGMPADCRGQACSAPPIIEVADYRPLATLWHYLS